MSKVAELIAQYHPVLQTEAMSTEIYLLTEDLVVNEPDLGGEDLLAFAKYQQFFENTRREPRKFAGLYCAADVDCRAKRDADRERAGDFLLWCAGRLSDSRESE